MKEISWEEGEKRILKNPEVAKECEKAETEFQALRQLILLRRKNKISQQKLAKLINSHHGRRWADHPLEFPTADGCLENWPRFGDRVHYDSQARRADSTHRICIDMPPKT